MSTMETTISTSLGKVHGAVDRGVYSWKGIPYAMPLEGSLLFEPPVPVPTWHGSLDARSFGPIAPQRSLLRSKIGAACLTINIWSPKTTEKRPVLFFIHGGAFSHGSGSEAFYHGSWLAREWDIVVVTCNYRLGIGGFLDLSILEDRFSGNNGFRDVLLALQWVHNHIERFGGDPECITIAGQSAGATMVSAVAASPDARKLFHRAIMMSGGPTQVQSVDICRDTSESFLLSAGIETSAQLLSLDIGDLVTRQKHFMRRHGKGAATFRITVDGELVPDFPIVAAARGDLHDLPMLIGTTKEEMGFMAIKPLARLIDVSTIVQDGLDAEDPLLLSELLDTYVNLYGEARAVPMMYTDLLFGISSAWLAEAVGTSGKAWMYRFDYETEILRMHGLHAMHATDLPYLFGNFKTALVRPMFLLNPDMSQVHAMAREIQEDVVTFMREGALGWDACGSQTSVGKCYDNPPVVHQMIDPRLRAIYDRSTYKMHSFSGVSV